MNNPGEDCWGRCHEKEGKCEWCGPDGYCCKKGHDATPNEPDVDCDDGAFGGIKRHECVPKLEKSYHSHCHNNGLKYSMRPRDDYFPYPQTKEIRTRQDRKKAFDKLQNYLQKSKIYALELTSFNDFMRHVKESHDLIHWAQFCTMYRTTTAAYAPQFWLHHSFIDKIFADWQDIHPNSTDSNLNDNILRPFEDKYYNPFSLTRKTTRQAWDYKENLCYRYEEFSAIGRSKASVRPPQDPYIVIEEECKRIGTDQGNLL